MKKIIMNLAVALVGLFGTTSANATVYFQSDFNSAATSAITVNGGLLNLSAYGLPSQYGVVRNSALAIYGGEAHNGANTGAISGSLLAGDLANGQGLLRMTGQYNTRPNYADEAWNQTGSIQWQNPFNYSTYNSIVISANSNGWVDFTLDLDLVNLDPSYLGQIQANFYIGGATPYNPGELHIDNLRIETVASIPEPSVASLLGFGVLGLVATRFRRRS
jgi:hypothetical protein